MRKFLLLIPLLLFCAILPAQRDTLPENAVFVEAGGNAYYYSVNYTRLVRWTPVAKSFRIGLCYFPGANFTYAEKAFMMPVEGTLLFGKHRHFMEAGLGFTFFSRMIHHHQSPGGNAMGLTDSFQRGSGFNLNARIGYCFLPARSNRLMLKVAFTPVYFAKAYYYQSEYPYENNVIVPWGGISVGYAF